MALLSVAWWLPLLILYLHIITSMVAHAQDILRVALSPSTLVAVEGNPSTWDCIITLSPSFSGLPTVSWTRDGTVVVSGNDMTVLVNGSLYFRHVLANHEAVYKCRAATARQEVVSQSGSLRLAFLGPNFLVEPSSVDGHVGDNISLTCEIASLPPPLLLWQRNGGRITRGEFHMITNQRSRLTLPNADYDVMGQYACAALNPMLDLNIRSRMATVAIEGPPVLTHPPQPTSASAWDTAVFHCIAFGHPTPTIEWLDNRAATLVSPIEPGSKYNISTTGSLQIWNLELSDSGFYTCQATNLWGTASKSVLLTVTEVQGADTLRFTLVPDGIEVMVGAPVTLTCDATGDPMPSIIWTRVSETYSMDRVLFPVAGAMRIHDVIAEDSGIYACIARNNHQGITYRVAVDVLAPPTVSITPSSVEVSEGSRLQLTCRASGRPEPELHWSSQGVITDDAEDLDNGTLLISSITASHQGQYTCLAVNTAGQALASAEVRVTHGVSIVIPPADTTAVINSTVVLSCGVSGNPSPRIMWFYNERYVDEEQRDDADMLANGSLVLRDIQLSQAGRYTCTAYNGGHSAVASAWLTVTAPPSFPEPRETVVLVPGTSAWIHCAPSATPPATTSWFYNGGRLHTGNGTFILENSTVYIPEVTDYHGGLYVCIASNSVGTASLTYDVTTTSMPEFVIAPSNTTGNASFPLEVYCDATPRDTVQITWYRAESLRGRRQQIMVPGGEMGNPVVLHNGSLIFDPLTSGHDGWYMCMASSPAGSLDVWAYVDVKFPPSVSTVEHAYHVSVNQSITILCVVRADPLAAVSWVSPEGRVFDTTYDFLSIQLASPLAHHGNWTCQACNLLGCGQTDFVLYVDGPPLIHDVTGYVDNEGDVLIRCVTIGYPPASVTYFWGRLEISEQDPPAGHELLDDGTMKIQSQYLMPHTCRATNLYGSDTARIEVPFPPQEIRIPYMGPSVIALSWDRAPNFPSPVTHELNFGDGNHHTMSRSFTVETPSYHRRKRTTTQLRITEAGVTAYFDDVTASSAPELMTRFREDGLTGVVYVIGGLHGYSRYGISIRSSNAMGTSSAQVLSVQMPSGPPGPVRDLFVVYNGAIVLVTWLPPVVLAGDPGDIEYNLTYETEAKSWHVRVPHESLVELMVQTRSDAPQAEGLRFEKALLNLNYTESYVIHVTASNLRGGFNGPSVNVSIALVDAIIIGIVRKLSVEHLNESTVRITWEPPDDRATVRGYLVQAYRIEDEPSNRPLVLTVDNVTSPESRLSLSLGQHSLSVAAYNRESVGPYSDAVLVNMVSASSPALGLRLEIILAIVAACLLVVMALTIAVVFFCRQRQAERLKQVHRVNIDAKSTDTYDNVALDTAAEGHSANGEAASPQVYEHMQFPESSASSGRQSNDSVNRRFNQREEVFPVGSLKSSDVSEHGLSQPDHRDSMAVSEEIESIQMTLSLDDENHSPTGGSERYENVTADSRQSNDTDNSPTETIKSFFTLSTSEIIAQLTNSNTYANDSQPDIQEERFSESHTLPRTFRGAEGSSYAHSPPDYMNLAYQNLYANGRMRTATRKATTLPLFPRSSRRVSRQPSFEVQPIIESDETKLSRGQLPISRDYLADKPELFYENDTIRRPGYYQGSVPTRPTEQHPHRLYSTIPPQGGVSHIAPIFPTVPNVYDRISLYDPYYSAVATTVTSGGGGASPRIYKQNADRHREIATYRRLQAHAAAATCSGRSVPPSHSGSSQHSSGKRAKQKPQKNRRGKAEKNVKHRYLDNFVIGSSRGYEAVDRTVENPIYNGQEQVEGLF